MEGEFNNFEIKNTNITFTQKVDNTATSDELTAALMYQDKMGTNYSKGKKVSKAVATTGIVLLATAASIKAGTIIINKFILNPPSVTMNECFVEEGVFHYSFTMSNPAEYETYYAISVDGIFVLKEECTFQDTYEGTFSEFKEGQKCKFIIEFTNGIDYTKVLRNISFNTEGVLL